MIINGVEVDDGLVYRALRYAATKCPWEVTRKGRLQPCMNEAIALRFWVDDSRRPHVTPVCRRHIGDQAHSVTVTQILDALAVPF